MKKINFFAALTLLLIFSFLPTFGQTSEIDHGFKKAGQIRLQKAEVELQNLLMDIKKYEGDIKYAVSRDTSEIPHVSEYLYSLKKKIDFFYEQKNAWDEQLTILELKTHSEFYNDNLNNNLKVICRKRDIIWTYQPPQVKKYFTGYFGREIKIDLYITYTVIIIFALAVACIEVFFLLILSYRITQSVLFGVLLFGIIAVIQLILVSIF